MPQKRDRRLRRKKFLGLPVRPAEGTSSSSNSGDDDDDGGPSSRRSLYADGRRIAYRSRAEDRSSSNSGDDRRCPSRRRGRRRGFFVGVSSFRLGRRRRAEDTSSSSSSNSGDDDVDLRGPSLRSYLEGRLDRLNLPPSADGVEPDSVDLGLLPYGEILLAFTRSDFLDDEMLRDAVAEYQVLKYMSEETVQYCDPEDGSWSVVERPRDSGADVGVYSVGDDISEEEFAIDYDLLLSRSPTPVDEYDKLDPEESDELELKRAFYRIKALLLLKGKAIDKLDDAALKRKYPREIIVENYYFLDYEDHHAFGWYFDSKLCEIASLTDYQRLVILNCWDDHYQDWRRYRSRYSTPQTDRDYLLYWKTITEKIKWIEDYMYVETSSLEWSDIWRKASYQAIRIATGFENIDRDLALVGIEELVWSTRLYVYSLKDLDGVFYEIWKRVIKEKNVDDCFAKVLKEVYDLKMFPSREQSMKDEQKMAEQFHLCTAGITEDVPESIARGMIAQQVRRKLAMTRGYEHYARKKLKVAEYIGLIGKAST